MVLHVGGEPGGGGIAGGRGSGAGGAAQGSAQCEPASGSTRTAEGEREMSWREQVSCAYGEVY